MCVKYVWMDGIGIYTSIVYPSIYMQYSPNSLPMPIKKKKK